MKQVIVGTYEMGHECVELVIREDMGGEYYTIPEKGHVARIKIGVDYKRWDEVVAVLLHEAMEFQADRHLARFRPTQDLSGDQHWYLFVLTHEQFSDCCAKVAEFLTVCLPELATAWKKWNKKRKVGKKP